MTIASISTLRTSLQRLAAIAFFLLICPGCYAASFDCEKATGQIEEAICGDQELSRLDEILHQTYRAVLKIAEDADALKNDQKKWLARVRSRCKESTCIFKTYEARISELEQRWVDRTAALNAAVVRDAPSKAKPFEGSWKSCQLFEGREICASYILVQSGRNVCGEWEDWATYREYSGRLQAITQDSNRASVEVICGTPGGEVSIECADEGQAKEKWQEATGDLSVCGGQLHKLVPAKSCSTLNSTSGFSYHPLSDKRRKEFLSQAWAKKCLGEE